jgi:DNA-binding transcriptional LysR family regulator
VNITLRQIEAFLAVAELGGFTRAAERIHLTQSAVTSLIRELEGQLSVRLLDRTSRRVRLTDAGREFFPLAEKALSELETAVQNTQELLAKKRGRLILAATPLIASTLLPRVIFEFHKSYPSVAIVLRDILPDEVLTRVRTGEADFGIGPFSRIDNDLVSTTLITDSLVLVCPAGHVLAKRRHVRWQDLAGHPMISLDRHSNLDDFIAPVLQSAGYLDPPAYHVTFVQTALSLVEAGLGVSVLPSYVVFTKRLFKLQIRKIVEPTIYNQYSVVTKRGRSLSPAAESFTDLFLRKWQGTMEAPGGVIKKRRPI